MFKRLAVTVAALTLVLGMTGCSEPKADKADLIEALKDDGLTDTEAECVADGIFDDKFEGDEEVLNDIAKAETEEDLPQAVRDAIDEVIADCTDN